MTVTSTRRTARKVRHCANCDGRIEPGHVYLEHKEFPGGEAGYADGAGHPVRMSECADCAGRFGREHLLGRVPDDQPYRYWLADGTPQPPDAFEGVRP